MSHAETRLPDRDGDGGHGRIIFNGPLSTIGAFETLNLCDPRPSSSPRFLRPILI